MQESAEVVLPILEFQSRREGPNDEEQGGAIDQLATTEPLFYRRDRGFTIPNGINRSGAGRAASLEPVSRVFDGSRG